MPHQFTTSYIEESLAVFRQYKQMAEGAMAQLSDDQLFATLDGEMNSIALIVKHMTGNMRSRWTNILTSDGEKHDRNRDTEFIEPPATRQALLERWETGWIIVFDAIEPLSDADLARCVSIRSEPLSVLLAIFRQVALYASHIGQII